MTNKVLKLGSKLYDEDRYSNKATLLPGEERIRFNCSRCRNRIKARFGQEGKPYRCPFCSEGGTVPYPDKPYKNSEMQSAERRNTRMSLLFWVFCLLTMCAAFMAQNIWMPLVGLNPSRAHRDATAEQAIESADAALPAGAETSANPDS